MKRLLALLMLTGWITTVSAQTQVLVLHHADNTTTDVELYTKPKITFENDQMVITSSVLMMSFKVGDVVRFSYKENNTAIDQAEAQADYVQRNGLIIFNGVKDTEKITVYKSDGTRIPVRFSSYSGYPAFSLASLPTGVYILNINGKSAKIVRQ